MSVYEIKGRRIDGVETTGEIALTDVYKEEIETVVDEFLNYYTGDIKFIHVGDVHLGGKDNDGAIRGFMSVIEVAKQIAADFIIMTGDIISGGYFSPINSNGTAEDWKGILKTAKNILFNCPIPILITRGNHDDNSISGLSDEFIIHNEWWINNIQKSIAYSNKNFIIDSSSTGYGFIDFPNKKLRVVCINASDLDYNKRLEVGGQNYMRITDEQITWMKNVAFSVENEWKIICFSHIDPLSMHHNAGLKYGSSETKKALDENSSKILAYIFGHTHVSSNYKDIDSGIIYSSATNAGGTIVDAFLHYSGKVSEYGQFSSASKDAKDSYPTGAFNFDICFFDNEGNLKKVRWGVKDDVFAS